MTPEIMTDMYNNAVSVFEENATSNCRIEWNTNTGEWDEITQTMINNNLNKVTKSVQCSFREERQIGEIKSSSIIETGIPTGVYKVFLKYSDRLVLSNMANLVENSLRFILFPNTDNPVYLHPNIELMKTEYFFDKEEYPICQRHICTLVHR